MHRVIIICVSDCEILFHSRVCDACAYVCAIRNSLRAFAFILRYFQALCNISGADYDPSGTAHLFSLEIYFCVFSLHRFSQHLFWFFLRLYSCSEPSNQRVCTHFYFSSFFFISICSSWFSSERRQPKTIKFRQVNKFNLHKPRIAVYPICMMYLVCTKTVASMIRRVCVSAATANYDYTLFLKKIHNNKIHICSACISNSSSSRLTERVPNDGES